MITIVRKTRRGPRLNDVVGRAEREAAAELARRAAEVWPVETGESSPRAVGNTVEFRGSHAKYVRRSGGRRPLVEAVIPRLAAEVAAETIDKNEAEFSAAITRRP